MTVLNLKEMCLWHEKNVIYMNKMLMKEKNIKKEKEYWVISESYLSQIWLARWLVLIIMQKTC